MQSYNSIKILPEHVTRKIAAGEVIDRPASIVKELMENSIDAHATRIEVFVSNGGMSNIIVQDDGVGIAANDIPLTIERNATSKIISDEDLLQLNTFGFRGEALSSISAVSKFELQTKRKDDTEGSSLKVDGEGHPIIEPSGTKNGTRIRVSNLFFNTPARKKFLRSKTTEFGHIEKTFKKIALAHPEIGFTLYKDEIVEHQLAPVKTYLDRIAQLYPKAMVDTLVPMESNYGSIKIHGYVSNSQTTFSGAQEIWLFINQRWITDRALQKAVLEGYRTALMEHRYPLCFVYMDLSPEQFDVNVHPTKAEVRFEKPQELFQALINTITPVLKQGPARHHVSFSDLQGPQSSAFEFTKTPTPYPTRSSNWYTPARERPAYIPEEVTQSPNGFFARLECLGSLDHTYILCRSSDALYIIDQHAAHERVLFDQFKNSVLNNKAPQQTLLIPFTLQLTSAQFECVKQNIETLKTIGFEMEEFGEKTWIVRTMPAGLKEKQGQQILLDFIDDALNETKSKTFEDHRDHVLSTMACHAAVRAHDALGMDEIRHLLTRMDEVDLSSYCPHGRPTFLKLDLQNLEVLFKRV